MSISVEVWGDYACFSRPELRAQVRQMLAQMHDLYHRGYTPKVKPTKSSTACSLKELCMPKLMKTRSVSAYLKAAMEETP